MEQKEKMVMRKKGIDKVLIRKNNFLEKRHKCKTIVSLLLYLLWISYKDFK